MVTYVDLSGLPLGSHDILIGRDWLESHREKLDCYNKTFACLDEEGNLMVVKGFPKAISGRNSSAKQLKNLCGERLQSVCSSCFGGDKE